jgi:WD40 repeat protein
MDAFQLADRRAFALAGPRGGAQRVWDLSTGRTLNGADIAELEMADAEALSAPAALTVVDDRVIAVTLDDRAEPELVGDWAAGYCDDGAAIRKRQTAVLGARRVALCAGADQELRVWDFSTSAELIDGIRSLRSISAEDGLLGLSPDPAERRDRWDLIAGREGGRVGTGNTRETGPGTTSRPVERRPSGGRPLAGHRGQVWDVATSIVDGRPVAVTSGADRTVRTWALATGKQVTAPLRIEAQVMTTGVVEGHAVIVTAGKDATVRAVDAVTGDDVSPPMPSKHGRVLAVATATLDGSPIAVTVGSDRCVGMWDLTTGKAVREPLTGHSSPVTAVATAVVDGRPVAVTGSRDTSVRLWDLTDGHQIGEPLTGHTDGVTSAVCVMVGGESAALTKGRDGTVRLWNLTTRAQITGHEATKAGAGGTLAAFNLDDGRLVVAVGHERTLRFLDATTGLPAVPDYLLPRPVRALAAAPDGYLVAAFGPEVAALRLRTTSAGGAGPRSAGRLLTPDPVMRGARRPTPRAWSGR